MTIRSSFSRTVVAVAAVAALGVSAACSAAPDGADATGPFDVLFIGGLTGPAAASVEATVAGLEAAADSVNENGGVAGRELALEVKDSQGDPTRAISLLQESLSGDEPPDVVIPAGSSAETLAMVPLLTRNEMVSVSFSASPLLNDPEQFPYHFQTTPNSTAQLVGLREHLEAAGVQRLGLLVSQDEYGNGVIEAVESQLEDSAIEVNASQFVPADVDVSVSYQRMLDTNPDFVYLDATGDPAVRLLQARVQTGATGVPTIAGSGMSLSAGGPFAYGSPEANQNLEILVFKVEVATPEGQQSEVFKDFIARMTADRPVTSTLSSSALAWDQLRLVAAAASQEGALDGLPGSLVDAVYGLEVPEGYWLTEKEFAYTPQQHSPTPTPEDFPFIPSSPMSGGQYQVGSGVTG